MKFLTFVDTHDDPTVVKELIKRAKQNDIDFMICAGDLAMFGQGLRRNLKQFNSVGKKFYIIPGNHEEYGLEYEKMVSDYKNCINFHKKVFEIGDYVFLGYGGGGFALKDPEFRKLARKWYGKYKDKKIILVTHGGPYGTKIDELEGKHVGNQDYTKFIERIKPQVVICGHLHETAGLIDNIGKTKVIHPGWEGMVLELK